MQFQASLHAISHNFMQISSNFHAIWTISAIFRSISTCWVSKSMYSNCEIHCLHFHTSSRMYSHNFMQISRNLGYFGYFGHFLTSFNMLGIKKDILQLRNSLMVLGEAIGRQKGPKTPKKRPKVSKRDRRPLKALGRS